jgi:23S rRNA pseudouridine2605 synthase
MPPERLQKIMAAAGVASRRKAEELITSGRVKVNGQVVTELGTKADAEQDHIRVDGKLLQGPERYTYIALNKPKGYVTTVSDPEKRPTVMDLVRGVKARVYPVGRLDWASEGLLLMTNDGALANGLMKAESHVPKVYVVKVAGQPEEGKLEKLRRGVSIAEKGGRRMRTAPAKVQLIREADNPWLEVTLVEGRNRQIRKMFEEVGHHVEKIRRVKFGPLSLDVPPGEFRNLTLKEVAQLKAAASGPKTPKPRAPKPNREHRNRAATAATKATASASPRQSSASGQRRTGRRRFPAARA